ncbi:MAG: hypothetical protein QOG53_396 [Frankiales bacterium]|jgi:PKD repeat protein|nr:hypothetical protein [Frankiales bacterium]
MASSLNGQGSRRRVVLRRWRSSVAVSVLALIATGVGLPTQSASAFDITQPTVVSDDPVTWTPQVMDGSVHALAMAGNTLVAGGTFTAVQDSHRIQPPVSRANLFAADATTGDINTTFTPTTNGQVEVIVAAPDGQSVYIGGAFNQVNGIATYNLAKIRLSDGSLDPTFKPKRLDGRVFTMQLANNKLYIGGSFTKVGAVSIGRLAALNPITGVTDTAFNVPFAGTHRQGTTSVQKFDITPDGTRMIVIGNFVTVGGLDRDQAAMLDLTGVPSVANWETDRYKSACSSSFNSYMHDVQFSPDGAYFVIGTTGAYFANTLCDGSARWETGATGSGLQPTWINLTGGDTIWSVAITGTAVYLGGHFRWQNNPIAANRPGPGAISRRGLAALDPNTGLPLDWDPTRELGQGVFDMLPTPQGLWIGHDTDLVANEVHSKLAFFPLAGGHSVPNPGAGSLPSTVYQIGQTGNQVGTRIIHRINVGGPSVKATEQGNSGAPDWAADDQNNPSPYHNAGSTTQSTSSSITMTGVPTTTPQNVMKDNRIDPAGDPEMTWSLPVAAGTPVEVRLYFASIDNVASGARIFDVSIDGSWFQTDYDIRSREGNRVAAMKQWETSSDGSIDIAFRHKVGDPTLAAIEVVKTCGAQDVLTPADSITRRSFDGTVVGAPTPVVTTGQAWSQSRGAFMLAGTLYTAWNDGKICSQSFDGTTMGGASPINYMANNFGNDLRNLGGMFYNSNRIFYTVPGQTSLFWRWFTPQSNVIGATAFIATPNITGIDFSIVGGMLLSGNKLYFTQWNNGLLRRIDWNPNTLTPIAGTQVTLSGPGIDGIDWRQQSLTMLSVAGTVADNRAPHATWASNCNQLACAFTSAGSGDPDGTVASYLWDFGDGSTSGLQTPSHTYAVKGTYNVTLTVTDNGALTGSQARPLTVTVPPQPPVASFTTSCVQLTCSVDASASTDADGTISSYAWNFGDSATTSGNPASHTYSAANTYTITLTVTDNSGMTGSTTRQVTVVAPAAAISFLGGNQVNGSGASPSVVVPATVAGGDGLLLMMVGNNSTLPPTTPSGWTQLSSAVKGSNLTTVWRKVASSSDAGTAVTVPVSGAGTGFRSALTVLAYRGTSIVDPISTFASAIEGTTGTTTHVTPTVTVPANNSWVVSLWTDKTSSTTSITPPGTETQRSATCGSDGGRVCLLATDGNAPVAAGTVAGGLTATASAAGTADTMWTIVLAPGS